MVVGIDSYHDSSKKGRSVGGVIASMNQALTRYYSRCTFQTSMQELLDGLKVCIKGLACMLSFYCYRCSFSRVAEFIIILTLCILREFPRLILIQVWDCTLCTLKGSQVDFSKL